MTCRAPQNHPFIWRRSAGRPDDPLLEIPDRSQVAALELGPRSEVDRLRVITGDGSDVVIGVGVPAVGPFVGPFRVQAYGAFPPINPGDDDLAYDSVYLNRSGPLVEVVRHFQAPAAFLEKRAPASRAFPNITLTGSYATIGEVPIYGRKLTTLSVANMSGAGTVTLQLIAHRYAPGDGRQRTPLDYDNYYEATGVQDHAVILVLDGSGGTTKTFTDADGAAAITITDERFDTIEVKAKTSGTNVVALTSETQD